MYIESVRLLRDDMDTQKACEMLGVSRSSYYHWTTQRASEVLRREKADNAGIGLQEAEKSAIMALMVSEEYCDKTPYEIFYRELDRGNYHCSVRTMYRLLQANEMVRERRRGHRSHDFARPELLAKGPNEVWSWDITKLKGPRKWTYFFLYVILDIFSRYVVGWLVAQQESAQLAKELIKVTCERQRISEDQLAIHSDRGGPMRSQSIAELLDTLSVQKSFSRPHVSNDNPYSESQFKTLKYHQGFPSAFDSIEASRQFCRGFFNWYNNEHYHSGLNYLTPLSVHYGYAEECLLRRQNVLDEAYQKNPERFKKGRPVVAGMPTKVWINKPADDSVHPKGKK